MKRLLIFHSTIAPYRIDFFNDLYSNFETKVCLRYENLRDQKFDYSKISSQFKFQPYYLNITFEKGGLFYSEDYWHILDGFKPDIVFVEEFNMSAILVLLHKKIKKAAYKIVSICDDSYNMIAENNDFSLKHKLARNFLAKKMDEIILVSPKVVDWYQNKYNKGFYFPIIKDDSAARTIYERCLPKSQLLIDEYGLQDKKVFLFVGRLVKIKNVDAILEAFSKLSQQTNKLVIIGGGDEENNLKAKAKHLQINVLFTGRLEGDELYAWYNVADIFVLPSYLEPFGAVTNEALLAGCFSIISQNAGSSCLIEEGVNGFVFDPQKNILEDKMKQAVNLIKNRKECVLKDNLMRIPYKEQFSKLVSHLNSL